MCVSVRIHLNFWLSHVGLSHVKPFTVKKDCNECWQRYLWLTALFCHWSSMWKAKPRNGDHSSFCLTNLAKMAKTLMWNVWPFFGNWNLCYFTCYLSYFTSKKMNLFLTLSLSVTFSLMRGPILSVARPCCAWGPGEDLRCLSQMFSDVSSLFHHCFTMATDLDMWSWLHLGCYSCYPCYHWPFWSASASLSVQCPLECVPRCLEISAKKSELRS